MIIHRKGRRTVKKIGAYSAAKQVAREVELRLAREDYQLPTEKPKQPTLDKYYELYRDIYLTSGVKSTTYGIYQNAFGNHILPKLGSRPLNQITRLDVEKFIAHLIKNKTLARSTIRIIMACLTACLNHAIEHGVIDKNPTYKTAKLYKQVHDRLEEIQPLTEDEVRLFLRAVLVRCPQHYPLFLCAFHTGMRSSELAGLQWGDVDFNGKYLMVRRQVVWGRVQTTKGNNKRRIDLSTALLNELKALKKQRKEQWLKEGKNQIPKWVFCNRKGNPADMPNLKSRHFHPCLEKAGLRRIRFHDTRHTFATSGVSI